MQKIADYFGVSVDSLINGLPQFEKRKITFDIRPIVDSIVEKFSQEVYEDPDLRLLFDAAEGSRPEDIRFAADLLMRLKGTNRDE